MTSTSPNATTPNPTTTAPFGTVFGDTFCLMRYSDGVWSPPQRRPLEPLSLHPASHALHYGSSCFEGLKAYRHGDATRIFRIDRHAERLCRSAEQLYLPCPPAPALEALVRDAVAANAAATPEPPGALYLRPTLIGTEANIGAAGSPSSDALLYVLTSPVGHYFAGGERALRILVDDRHARAVAGFGQIKTGANYAAALRHTVVAKQRHRADQVLFCPDGDVQETGASNFLLIDGDRVLTKPLDESFLHGVTRDSLLRLAERLQYRVIERDFSVAELLAWVDDGGEAALSGTAAVLAGVGTLIYQDREIRVGDGATGVHTRRLRDALCAIQHGDAADEFGWLS